MIKVKRNRVRRWVWFPSTTTREEYEERRERRRTRKWVAHDTITDRRRYGPTMSAAAAKHRGTINDVVRKRVQEAIANEHIGLSGLNVSIGYDCPVGSDSTVFTVLSEKDGVITVHLAGEIQHLELTTTVRF